MTERAKKLLLLYCKQGGKIRRVSGLPLLTFKAKKAGTLKDYRIYGNTAGGESVGDRTGNLFDFGEWSKNINANGDNSLAKGIDGITITANSNDVFTTPYAYVHEGVYKIYVKPNTNYLLSWTSNNDLSGRVFIFKNGMADGTHAVNTNNSTTKYLLFGTDADTEFITLRFGVTTAGNTITYSKIMLNEGSTALPYEPYGNKVPVTVEGKNLFDETYPSIVPNTAKYKSIYVGDGQFTLSTTASVYSGTATLFLHAGIATEGSDSAINGVHSQRARSVTSIDGYVTIGYRIRGKVDPRNYNTMLNAGSAALPYEPYHAPITTPIYLPEPIKMVGDEAGYIDYAEQKQHRVRKNLLKNTAKSQTINGVTFTVNSDGSVTCNGKCVNNVAVLYIKRPTTFYDETIQYTLTGCPVGGAYNSTYALEYTNSVNQVKPDVGNGVSFTPYRKEFYPNACIRIVIFVGYTCDNLTFYPMIRKSDIEDDTYEPYIENTDLDVTLPALPVLPGTNTLTVGTEVQPSSVEIKGRIKAAEGD